MEFLGFHLCSQTLQIPSVKMRKIQQDATKMLTQDQVTIREMARFVGKAVATVHAFPLAPLHYRALQFRMNAVPPSSPIPARESSILVQHKSATGRTEQGRFEMVDTAGQKDNRITNLATTTLDANRVRCINQGMGCSTEHSDTNRGCVVGTGSHQSHQLLRAIGGIPSTQILWQDLESYDSPASVGQFYSSDLH